MIPADLRAVLGKSEFKVALNTKDENEAIRLGAPILADWSDRIDEAKGKASLAVAPLKRQAIDRDRAFTAIQRWRSSKLKAALNAAFNGELEPAPVGFSDTMRDHVQMVGDLRSGDWSKMADFDAKLAEALNSQGIMCDPLHPAITAMRSWFADALASVEHTIMEYRKGNLADAPEALFAAPVVMISETASPSSTPSKVGPKVMEVFDQWVAIDQPQEPERVRSYVKLLVSFLGNKPMADIDHDDLDRFLIELRKYPMTKKDVSKLSFVETIAKFERDEPGYQRIGAKTVWGYFRHYKLLWTFAHSRRMIPYNPVSVVMPKKPPTEIKRKAYDAADVAAIFSTPLFHGADKMLDKRGKRWAYSKLPGGVLVKDAYYWLPIFALWHGVRMEEIGGARVAELVKIGDRWAFDWTDRDLKNESSARFVPIHKKLIELGFIDHIRSQPEDGFVFPDLPHDPADEEAATKRFSKWWGMWCAANAKVKGQGFDEPQVKVFHSFRHSFKRQARGIIQENISDILSGHKGIASEGRKYGFGAEFDVLAEAIDKIDFPTFPKLTR